MNEPTVTEVWRYPAKSMLGERLETAEVTGTGIVGDRGWAVRDEVRGGIRGAKKISPLMGLAARYLAEPTVDEPSPHVEITLPDGSAVRSDDPGVHQRLGAALDHPVTLWPLQPPSDLDHYRRGAADSDDLLTELRDIFGRTETEPLPDLSVFPPEILEYESPPGTYVDAFPLLVMSTGTMATLQGLLPDSAIDLRRFRPNLVVDVGTDIDGADDPATGDRRWPELAWVGRRARIGSTVIELVTMCPRCKMITLPVQELPTDRAIMRTVVAEADQCVGVYATVVEPGHIAVGDRFELL